MDIYIPYQKYYCIPKSIKVYCLYFSLTLQQTEEADICSLVRYKYPDYPQFSRVEGWAQARVPPSFSWSGLFSSLTILFTRLRAQSEQNRTVGIFSASSFFDINIFCQWTGMTPSSGWISRTRASQPRGLACTRGPRWCPTAATSGTTTWCRWPLCPAGPGSLRCTEAPTKYSLYRRVIFQIIC